MHLWHTSSGLVLEFHVAGLMEPPNETISLEVGEGYAQKVEKRPRLVDPTMSVV